MDQAAPGAGPGPPWRSVHRPATCQVEHPACRERAPRAAQEEDHLGDLLDPAEPAHRDLGLDPLNKPVFIGDTVTVTYRIDRFDATKRRTFAKVDVTNQDGELVAIADHLLQWVRNE